MRKLSGVALAVALTVLAGCGADQEPRGGAIGVVAGLYPLQYVAEQIGGDRVEVTNLAQSGTEPHDLELSPRQVASIVDADLVLYLGGFQPAVDEATRQEATETSFDVATAVELLATGEGAHSHDGSEPEAAEEHGGEEHGGEEHGADEHGTDPHVWLDPTRLATIGDAVAQRLATIDPDHAADYRQRAAAFATTLQALDAEYREGLGTCARREIMVSHAAFGYLAERYDLEQVALSGIAPDGEPTPRRLAEVAHEADAHQATTIFFESLVSPRVAEAIATETGTTTAVLDPIEGQPDGGDYLSAMRANLAALTAALGCEQ